MGNPHIVAATKRDYALQIPHTRTTFPEPLPAYLPRTATLSATVGPTRDPNTANAGRFSLSLKGMRRELRKSGFRAETLVRDVEFEVVEWLQAGGTVLAPDAEIAATEDFTSVGSLIGETGTIFEVSRTPLQLVWSITDDSFARYVVHCCARYHEIVSFSQSFSFSGGNSTDTFPQGKEVSGRRLTYLLRPNVTRPDHHAANTLDTPPVTDLDYSSHPDTDTDQLSEVDSDIEHPAPPSSIHALAAISEDAAPTPPSPLSDDESWSVIGVSDFEDDESGNDAGLAASVESLSLSAAPAPGFTQSSDNDRTPRADLSVPSPLRSRVWEQRNGRQGRSASSPSRSPARRPFRRGLRPLRFDAPRKRGFILPAHHVQSFYDYLFL